MATREKHRSHLPMLNSTRPPFMAYDAKDPDYKSEPIEQLRPPDGAPNVLIVLIDDAGFGASTVFGGPCRTPNAERLAADGLRFNRFHTTAICSATRQAMLTGRNHHSAGMAGITEIATGAPGYSSVLPNTMSPLAKTLKLNGYSTAQFGKCHEVPVWQSSPMGPPGAAMEKPMSLMVSNWTSRPATIQRTGIASWCSRSGKSPRMASKMVQMPRPPRQIAMTKGMVCGPMRA